MISNSFKQWLAVEQLWEHLVWLWQQVHIFNEARFEYFENPENKKQTNMIIAKAVGLVPTDPTGMPVSDYTPPDFVDQIIKVASKTAKGAGLEAKATDMISGLWEALTDDRKLALINARRNKHELVTKPDGTRKAVPVTDENGEMIPLSKEEADAAVTRYVFQMINNLQSFVSRKAGSRKVTTLYSDLERRVAEDQPFINFKDNDAAKDEFVARFNRMSPRNYDEFLKFLDKQGHAKSRQIAASSGSLATAEVEDGDSSGSGGFSGHALATSPTQHHAMELESYQKAIEANLQAKINSGGKTPTEIRQLETAIKMLPALLQVYAGEADTGHQQDVMQKYQGATHITSRDERADLQKILMQKANVQPQDYYPAFNHLKDALRDVATSLSPELKASIDRLQGPKGK